MVSLFLFGNVAVGLICQVVWDLGSGFWISGSRTGRFFLLFVLFFLEVEILVCFGS